jgi:hypothetical protein
MEKIKCREKCPEMLAQQWFPGVQIEGVEEVKPWKNIQGKFTTHKGILNFLNAGDYILTNPNGGKMRVKQEDFEDYYEVLE